MHCIKNILLFFFSATLSVNAQLSDPLESPVNSQLPEFAPAVSPDGSTLYFQSYIEDTENWGLFRSCLTDTAGWSNPEPLASLNYHTGGGYTGTPFIDSDNSHIWFSSNREGGEGGADIWIAELTDSGASTPVNIGAPVNSLHYETSPSVTSDGKTLYFLRFSGEKNSKGYFFGKVMRSELGESGLWSKPEELSNMINTGNEVSARILPDDRTMIFSSMRDVGIGGYDLYYTKMNEDSLWSSPELMGFLSTPSNDELITFTKERDHLYYSVGDERKEDIYHYKVPEEYSFSGTVADGETGKIISARLRVYDEGRNLTGEYNTDDEKSAFQFTLPRGGYILEVVPREGAYYFHTEEIDLKWAAPPYMEITINLDRLIAGVPYILGKIYFDSDKYTLKKESLPQIDIIAELMKINPDIKVEISAHTDDVGSEAYNMQLSENRAEEVVKYLVKEGIPKERVTAKGYGEVNPIVPNHSPEQQAMNRRVELMIIE